MATTTAIEEALDNLNAESSLTILDLSAGFLTLTTTDTNRDSNASDTSSANATSPSLLAADLAHYRDLFSKLRFSYVEQVTKERFLRSLVSNPPEFTNAEENAELEAKLTVDKAGLKERKDEVAALIQELEAQGRQLVGRYERCRERRVLLESLPAEIKGLEVKVEELRARQEPQHSNPELALPLQPTKDLLAEREDELEVMNTQIAALQQSIPVRRQEVESLRDELEPLQQKKVKAVQEAQDARRRREQGNEGLVGDEMDERGRWLRGVEAGLRGMLEV
ncbi:hypothetical protein LTR62_002247 [Meristemomyces frigidus]|uniref:Kinetochore protein Sos7 coiled-coil domain-containing protein n=1 Tax=Meristemomyces frigidus TaxID=1508187 RepID=A0AAN7TT38_9PEZI|nr:hypothetical protein LTR62_002247 [Meristemomyces frigidus]